MKVELTELELVFIRSAIKTRWAVRGIGMLLGASSGSDGAAFTDQFVFDLLKKLEGK